VLISFFKNISFIKTFLAVSLVLVKIKRKSLPTSLYKGRSLFTSLEKGARGSTA